MDDFEFLDIVLKVIIFLGSYWDKIWLLLVSCEVDFETYRISGLCLCAEKMVGKESKGNGEFCADSWFSFLWVIVAAGRN